jgi:hypothetical protein
MHASGKRGEKAPVNRIAAFRTTDSTSHNTLYSTEIGPICVWRTLAAGGLSSPGQAYCFFGTHFAYSMSLVKMAFQP